MAAMFMTGQIYGVISNNDDCNDCEHCDHYDDDGDGDWDDGDNEDDDGNDDDDNWDDDCDDDGQMYGLISRPTDKATPPFQSALSLSFNQANLISMKCM